MPAASELFLKGRYRVDSSLSEDGTSALLQAYDTTGNSKVMVKEIAIRLGKVTTLSQQENLKTAFSNLASTLTGIHHDSIVGVTDYFAEVGRQYLVLEFPEGKDLQALAAEARKPLLYREVAAWGDQLLDAVNYLHNLKPSVIHSKIRPRHVIVSPDGKVKLFGHGVSDGNNPSLTTLFNDSTRHATDLNYSPLEAIWDGLDAASQKVIVNSYDDASEKTLKEPLDARSDIYSIGATLYFLLTGKLPTDPLERSIELLEGSKDPLIAPEAVNSDVPQEVSEIVMRALAIKREDRYDSAMIMRQVLKTALVRVKEREAEAPTSQSAEAPSATTQPAATKSQPAQQTQLDDAALLKQKLREAEEQRLAAELRAAEAERLLRERSEAESINRSFEPQKAPVAPEDDLLGLTMSGGQKPPAPSRPTTLNKAAKPPMQNFERREVPVMETALTPEPEAPKQEFNPDPEVLAKPEPEPEKVAEPAIPAAAAEINEEPSQPFSEPEDHATLPVHFEPAAPAYSDEDDLYSEAPKRASMPLAMFAGAAVILIVLAGGIWYFFIGAAPASEQSSTPAANSAQQPVAGFTENNGQAVQPETAVQEKPAAQTSTAPQETETTTAVQPVAADEDEAKRNIHTAPVKTKPSKTESETPAKTPEPKKKVTVDDLINDTL